MAMLWPAAKRARRSYRDAVLATAPVGYWRFGERSGTVARDEMGLNHGTYVNTPTLGVNGLVAGGDTAVTFNGTTQRITCAASPVAASASGMSCLAWLSTTAVSGALVASHSGAADAERWVLALENGAGQPWFYHSGVARAKALVSVSNGARALVGVSVVAGVSSQMFINGVTSGVVANDAGGWSSALPLTIGAQVTTLFLAGTIDEVAIWNRALTAGEIANLYSIGRG